MKHFYCIAIQQKLHSMELNVLHKFQIVASPVYLHATILAKKLP